MNVQSQTTGSSKSIFAGSADTIFSSLGLQGDAIKAVTPYWEYLNTLGDESLIAVARANFITSVLMSVRAFNFVNH